MKAASSPASSRPSRPAGTFSLITQGSTSSKSAADMLRNCGPMKWIASTVMPPIIHQRGSRAAETTPLMSAASRGLLAARIRCMS